MINIANLLISSFIFLCLLGCSAPPASDGTPLSEPTATEESVDQPAAPPPGPPSFSTAISRNLPSGTVAGADNPTPFSVVSSNIDLAAASNLAAEMQSFALLVWHNGELKHAQYFDPHDENLRPESASMHKSVLALVVGAAVDQGLISGTDAAIGSYLDEWADDPRGEITIEQLLQMSSGLKPLNSEGGMQSESMRFMAGENVRETILNLELKHDPGTVFHYAGTVNQLLGLIVERTSGKPYEQFLSEAIWQPIGADTAYVWYNEETGFPRTHTGLLATAQDWLKLGLLVKDFGKVNDQQIISREYIDAMTSPSPANENYGYQTWLGTTHEAQRFYNDAKVGFGVIASEPFLVDDMIYFDGFGGQRVYISRSLDLVIVRTGEVRLDWDDAKLPNLVISAITGE